MHILAIARIIVIILSYISFIVYYMLHSNFDPKSAAHVYMQYNAYVYSHNQYNIYAPDSVQFPVRSICVPFTHTHSKEPLVFTHIDEAGQGISNSHSLISAIISSRMYVAH